MSTPKQPPMVSSINLSASDRRRVERARQDLTDHTTAPFDTDPMAMAQCIGRLQAHLAAVLHILHDGQGRP